MIELVVTQIFEQYGVGQRITDQAEIARVQAEYPHNVVRVAAELRAPEPRPIEAKPARSAKA